jgi:hypothetical protein
MMDGARKVAEFPEGGLPTKEIVVELKPSTFRLSPEELKQYREICRREGVAQRAYVSAQIAKQDFMSELQAQHPEFPFEFQIHPKNGAIISPETGASP